jgi:hypothetical protein
MRQEEIRIGRVHDDDAHGVVVADLLDEAGQFADQVDVEQIDRRTVDRGAADAISN